MGKSPQGKAHESLGGHHFGGISRRHSMFRRRLASREISMLFLAAAMTCRAQAPGPCMPVPAQPLTLAAAEQRIEPCNREVRAAALAVDAARGDLRIAGQRPNPTLSLTVNNMSPHAGLGSGSLRDKAMDQEVRLEQLIERGGKPGLRVAQGEANVRAAQADLAEQKRQQRLAVRTAFFELAAVQERVTLQREFRTFAQESVGASRRRLDAGDIATSEANRFRLDAVRVENDLRQAETDLYRARLELARLLGAESMAPSLQVAADWMLAARPPASGERPDVVAARLRVEAAENARELARQLGTRDVTLGLEADRSPVTDVNPTATGITYGVSISIPLFVRHRSEGELAKALAELEIARAALERVRAQADAEARVAEQEWSAASERRERLEKEVRPIARDVASAAEYAYSRGTTGVLDLLDARRSLKGVELDELQARVEAAKAWARREAALEVVEPNL
jgi:cobalt-zinc-cadmium efflux system outer membrane protein